jgi:hypothetical protein
MTAVFYRSAIIAEAFPIAKAFDPGGDVVYSARGRPSS